jgi:hypothetical protein
MTRYLDQLRVSLRPSSVVVIDTTLRQLAGYAIDHHPLVRNVAAIDRDCIEGYKHTLGRS